MNSVDLFHTNWCEYSLLDCKLMRLSKPPFITWFMGDVGVVDTVPSETLFLSRCVLFRCEPKALGWSGEVGMCSKMMFV